MIHFQTLFDPINPDKDTVQTRKWSPRERQDNEFWLLQRLDDIMEKANFHELPKSVVKKAMEEHDAAEGVRVGEGTDELRRQKACLQGFQPGPTKTGLYSHGRLLEA